MKTTLLLLALCMSTAIANAQQYEYAEITATVKGFKMECTFNFGTKYDSVAAYGKFRYTVDALDHAAKKGWELVEVTKFQVLDVYLLRRKLYSQNN